MTRLTALLAASAAVVLTACAAPAETTSSEASAGPKADASAKVACRHFRNVVGDADTLTDDELRQKMKEVAESASVSEVEGLAPATRAALVAITQDDVEAFGAAVADVSEACASVSV